MKIKYPGLTSFIGIAGIGEIAPNIMNFENSIGSSVSNLTITGGAGAIGGGMHLSNSVFD